MENFINEVETNVYTMEPENNETRQETTCECRISGRLLTPQSYMKIISHDLRKDILHKLHVLTIDQPTTKHQLANSLGINYEKVNYQLNEHLEEFWEVKDREKIRGTYREYIAPEIPNAIYINIGTEGTIFTIDPLANLFGRIAKVGTRCEQCSKEQRERCLAELQTQKCFQTNGGEKTKWEKVLESNAREKPFTPVDLMLTCSVAKILEREPCMIQLTRCGCPFLKKLRREQITQKNE